MKNFVLMILSSLSLLGATHEQIEEYLLLSNAEEQLIELERQYSAMQRGFKADDNASSTYDMQLLSIRFKSYLQKHLSEDEMDEILKLYKNTLMLRFANATSHEYDRSQIESYIAKLEEDPEARERKEKIEEIGTYFYSPEHISILFDKLIAPLYQNGIGGENVNDEFLKKMRKIYLETMQEAGKYELLYATREFSIEELEALIDIVKEPAIQKEAKAVYGALAYALKDFFHNLTGRFDVKKHSFDEENSF